MGKKESMEKTKRKKMLHFTKNIKCKDFSFFSNPDIIESK